MKYSTLVWLVTFSSISILPTKLFCQDYKPYTEFGSNLEGLKERRTGRIIIPAKYTDINDYYNGLSSVYKYGMGYVVIDSTIIIIEQYSDV